MTILSTLPSAGVGALLALMLTHTELTVIAFIGIILLIGIVNRTRGAGRELPSGDLTPEWEGRKVSTTLSEEDFQSARNQASRASALAAGTPSAHTHSSPLRRSMTAPLAADPINTSGLERWSGESSGYLWARIV